jgi:hypothetical protein
MPVYLDRIAALHRAGRPTSQRLLRRLQIAWGNGAYSGSRQFLATMLLLLKSTDGPVLECGSGLSTLVISAVLAGERQLVALEHHRGWRDAVSANERVRMYDNVKIMQAPLVSYGDYSWYAVDRSVLPASFGLIICDGPPGDTPGGRYGLVPVLRAHLRAGTIILLDDTQRGSEQCVSRRWIEELPAEVVEQLETCLVLRVR